MAKTRLGKYIRRDIEVSPITSDHEIRFAGADEAGDEMVWCGDPAGDNPEVVIEATRGNIISITVSGRTIR